MRKHPPANKAIQDESSAPGNPASAVTAPSIQLSFGRFLLLCAAIPTLAALMEWAMGRRLISASGRIELWAGGVNDPENSQQLADWYSLTHILHGILFYGLMRLVIRGKVSPRLFFLMALLAEATWEVLENSPFIIDRYRAATAAVGYYGDTILNSMSDIFFCMVGFVLARHLPVWLTITLVAVIEVGLALAIRDNLTLNILMLIHPFQAIKQWQMGA